MKKSGKRILAFVLAFAMVINPFTGMGSLVVKADPIAYTAEDGKLLVGFPNWDTGKPEIQTDGENNYTSEMGVEIRSWSTVFIGTSITSKDDYEHVPKDAVSISGYRAGNSGNFGQELPAGAEIKPWSYREEGEEVETIPDKGFFDIYLPVEGEYQIK